MAATMLFACGTASANSLSAEQIAAAVLDRTYQGSMIDNAFAEYLVADGSKLGKNHSGKWPTDDDITCFQCGASADTCWNVLINGPALALIKEGEVDGSGMVVDGNPDDL